MYKYSDILVLYGKTPSENKILNLIKYGSEAMELRVLCLAINSPRHS